MIPFYITRTHETRSISGSLFGCIFSRKTYPFADAPLRWPLNKKSTPKPKAHFPPNSYSGTSNLSSPFLILNSFHTPLHAIAQNTHLNTATPNALCGFPNFGKYPAKGTYCAFSTYPLNLSSYFPNAASRSEGFRASSPAITYDPKIARTVPIPVGGEGQYAASPVRTIRPVDHVGNFICAVCAR